MENYYGVLELDKNCTEEEIKNSYIKLSKKFHPDKNKSEDAKRKILKINEAYSVLKNKSTRYEYDQRLQLHNRKWQTQQNCQNEGAYNYNRPPTYDDYVQYYKGMRTSQCSGKPHAPSKQFGVVLCCFMLMMFGAGLRIMYAWSQAYKNRKISEMNAKDIRETTNCTMNSKLEKMQQILKKK